jgi:hypothetical protein
MLAELAALPLEPARPVAVLALQALHLPGQAGSNDGHGARLRKRPACTCRGKPAPANEHIPDNDAGDNENNNDDDDDIDDDDTDTDDTDDDDDNDIDDDGGNDDDDDPPGGCYGSLR